MAKKILLIDDELDFLEIMGHRIRSWGYEVMPVSSGKEAIDNLKSEKPDVIILDYKMPDMDGVVVLKQIRKVNKKIPVVMLTAYPDEECKKITEKLGVSVFIPKLSAYSDVQVTLKTVLDMIEKKLDSSNKQP